MLTIATLACTTCNPDVQDGILDGRFALIVLALGLPFVLAAAIAYALHRL